MGIFGKGKARAAAPAEIQPPPFDDGAWRRLLKAAGHRAALKRSKLLTTTDNARRDAAVALNDPSAAPNLAAAKVSPAVVAQRQVAALDAMAASASALVTLAPSLSPVTSLFNLSPIAQRHVSTVLAAADPPPLVSECSHLAGMLNAHFTSRGVAGFRATVEPDRALLDGRSTLEPPPSEIRAALEAVSRDFQTPWPQYAGSSKSHPQSPGAGPPRGVPSPGAAASGPIDRSVPAVREYAAVKKPSTERATGLRASAVTPGASAAAVGSPADRHGHDYKQTKVGTETSHAQQVYSQHGDYKPQGGVDDGLRAASPRGQPGPLAGQAPQVRTHGRGMGRPNPDPAYVQTSAQPVHHPPVRQNPQHEMQRLGHQVVEDAYGAAPSRNIPAQNLQPIAGGSGSGSGNGGERGRARTSPVTPDAPVLQPTVTSSAWSRGESGALQAGRLPGESRGAMRPGEMASGALPMSYNVAAGQRAGGAQAGKKAAALPAHAQQIPSRDVPAPKQLKSSAPPPVSGLNDDFAWDDDDLLLRRYRELMGR